MHPTLRAVKFVLVLKIINILPFLFVFVASLYNSADLDLGWHLKYGQYFVQNHQVLRVNTLSSEMTDYHYPNTSWAADILLYVLFAKLGFLALTILGAVVITLTFYFFSKAVKLTLFQNALLLPILIYLLAPQNAAGYRAQLLSFLFIGILFYLLTNYRRLKTEYLFLIIPLFLGWTNTHGEYLTGAALASIWFVVKTAQYFFGKSRDKHELDSLKKVAAALSLSFLVTLVNPFGINIYLESLRHFGNPLQKYVIEWLPFPTFSNLWWNVIITGIFCAAGCTLLLTRKKISENLPIYIITFTLLLLSLASRRYSWTFFYFSIFLTAPLIAQFGPRNQKTATMVAAIFLPLATTFAAFAKLPLTQFTNMSWDTYCLNYVECSPKSVHFIEENGLGKNLYSLYDWGGYIMWNSNIKPNMDGRMALWRDQNNYSAFEKYYALQQNWEDIDKSSYNTVLINHRKPLYLHLLDLTKEGKWKIGYQDEIATVFIRRL